jgi:hypothetical protein
VCGNRACGQILFFRNTDSPSCRVLAVGVIKSFAQGAGSRMTAKKGRNFLRDVEIIFFLWVSN